MCVLQGKVALVAGGADGIGRLISTELARAGASIAIVDSDESAAAELATSLEAVGAQAIAIRCDVKDSSDVTKAVKATVEWFGTVSILVNSAHAPDEQPAVEDMSDEDFERATAVAATTFRFMRACHPHLANGGQVINVCNGSDVVTISDSTVRDWSWHGISINTLVLDDISEVQSPDRGDPPNGTMVLRIPAARDDVSSAAILLAGLESAAEPAHSAPEKGADALVA